MYKYKSKKEKVEKDVEILKQIFKEIIIKIVLFLDN